MQSVAKGLKQDISADNGRFHAPWLPDGVDAGQGPRVQGLELAGPVPDQRVQRVMDRSGLTEAEVRQRIARQWPDAQKRALTTLRDFILDNSGSEDELRDQVAAVDAELRRR